MVLKDGKEILIKSAEIISSDGIENFSLSRLAERLGIRKASLYHYYKSKEEILEGMHDYFHQILLKRGYRIDLEGGLEENLEKLIRHWQEIFFSDETYDYLRCLLIMRQTDERAHDEWRSISLTIEGQSRIIIEKYTNSAEIKGPLFSSLLELNLERALIEGEGEDLESLASKFSLLILH